MLLVLFFSLCLFAQETPPTRPATPFTRLLLIGDVNLMGFDWKDLGLERESQFTAPLLRSWEKWLTENLPKTIGEAKVCEADCKSYHAQWEEKTPESAVTLSDPYYQDVLWLKINLTLRRTLEGSVQTYAWEGRVLLLDGNTKKAIANLALPRESKEWLNTPQGEINSALVTRVYRTPLGVFPAVVESSEKALPLNRVIRLVITGQKNMADVLKLVELLQSRGSSLGLKVEMSEFGSGEAVMRGYYRGEEKSFTDLLSHVKELKSSYNYSLVNEVTDSGHVIRMVKK